MSLFLVVVALFKRLADALYSRRVSLSMCFARSARPACSTVFKRFAGITAERVYGKSLACG